MEAADFGRVGDGSRGQAVVPLGQSGRLRLATAARADTVVGVEEVELVEQRRELVSVDELSNR